MGFFAILYYGFYFGLFSDSTLGDTPEDDATSQLKEENVVKESRQELEENQTSSSVTSRPTTSSRRRTHSESGICRFMMQSFPVAWPLRGKSYVLFPC